MLIVSRWIEFISELDLEMRLKGIRLGLFYLILPSMLNSFFDFVAGLAGIESAVPVNVSKESEFFFCEKRFIYLFGDIYLWKSDHLCLAETIAY